MSAYRRTLSRVWWQTRNPDTGARYPTLTHLTLGWDETFCGHELRDRGRAGDGPRGVCRRCRAVWLERHAELEPIAELESAGIALLEELEGRLIRRWIARELRREAAPKGSVTIEVEGLLTSFRCNVSGWRPIVSQPDLSAAWDNYIIPTRKAKS